MEKYDLNQLIGCKMEPRYVEYNWRDVALYALAVGAHKEDLSYYYEKYLKAIPTFGAVPYWATVNVRPTSGCLCPPPCWPMRSSSPPSPS